MKAVARKESVEFPQSEEFKSAEVIELPTVDQIQTTEFETAPFRKYEARERKRIEANSPVSLNWDYADRIFLPGGYPPRRETTVAGKIFGVVKRAGPEGITGRDLVISCSQIDFSRNPSPFTKGRPPISWIEDYITGMLRVRHSHLKLKTD